MLHDEGWHFYRLGRLLERADKTSRLLDVKYFMLLPSVTDVGTPLDDIQWAAVLRSASALEMYRKRHGPIVPEQIIKFLVLDREFPRSVHYCLTTANDSVHAISGTPIGMYRNTAEQHLGRLRAELAYTDTRQIVGAGCTNFSTGYKRNSIWWTNLFSIPFLRCARWVRVRRIESASDRERVRTTRSGKITMYFEISHKTTYTYSRPVFLEPHQCECVRAAMPCKI